MTKIERCLILDRMKRLVCLLCLTIIISCKLPQDIIEISPIWQYKIVSDNDNIQDILSEKFQPVTSTKNLHELLPEKKGFLWLKTEFKGDIVPKKEPLSIGLGKIVWADETYLNGSKIGKMGKFSPYPWNAWTENRIYPFEKNNLQDTNVILLKIYAEGEGLVEDKLVIGYRKDVEFHYLPNSIITSYINIPLAFLFFFISVYHFLIYFKRKKEKENFYYAWFGIIYSIYITNFFSSKLSYIGISYLAYQKIIFSSIFIASYFLAKFLTVFMERVNKPYIKYTLIASCLIPIFIEVLQPNYILLRKVTNLLLIFIFPIMSYSVYVTIWGLKQGKKEAKVILYGLIPLLILISYDAIFIILGKPINYFVSGLGFTIFLSSIMFMIANKTVEIHNYTDDLNANLEAKVKERTREVTQKMEVIEALKIQQDGDYFLISLIEKPLATNYNKSVFISTEFYISQKKQFQFRNRNAEVGGDICVTGNLRFFSPENRYVVFFNGDAMGKSMQGAGGFIVMGTAINYIISRSAKNDRLLFITPEQWLRETYFELNNIFKTFNGSMMISGVLGLVNESTGEMVYFNAEHPWTVLLREKEATFIETELSLRKLGCDSEFDFSIKRFQLLPGDVLIVGSDGRDDLDIGNEYKVMNEDETLFLKFVKYAEGDIKKIVELIQNAGKITDDLSLLRVGYKENTVPVNDNLQNNSLQVSSMDLENKKVEREIEILKNLIEQFPNDSQYLIYLANIYVYHKLFDLAIPYLERYISIEQNPVEALFKLSVSYLHTKQFEKSIQIGEKVLKFQPGKIANLLNLAEGYRQAGKPEKSLEFVNEVLKHKPQNKTALLLQKKLKLQG
ncbi:MAG: SpoIIE family protein phosphatase [Leptospiraceae bacterium]|nr:SpoIIE family protein phosphatase [Leptospiraceae bacterium]